MRQDAEIGPGARANAGGRRTARVAAVAVFVVLGAAFFAFGTGWRAVNILIDRQVEAPPPVEAVFGGEMADPPADAPALTEMVEVTVTERAVIKDVTLAGLALDADGRIKRTYGDTPPAKCPT